MKPPRIVVLSTGFAPPTAHLCKASVKSQRYPAWMHVALDAAEQSPPLRCSENLAGMIGLCRPDDVVVHLDLDDWLRGPDSLSVIADAYLDPDLWMTWGSYDTSDGRKGIAGPYRDDENCRTTPWRLSHLKTFRAGLAQRIRPEDLHLPDGQWTHRAVDLALMFPMFEMAGPRHRRYLPDLLAVYHYSASFEAGASPAQLEEERAIAAYFRGMPPYAPIASYL
jgi:hypothetical protein